jgi:emfourin
MRIRFQRSGGIAYFPGLAAPRTIDVDALPESQRRALIGLIEDCDFFTLPSQIPAAPGAADHRTYQVTIEDGLRNHSVAASDPITSPPLARLIEFLSGL